MKIILLTKMERFSKIAQSIALEKFDDLTILQGNVGDDKPAEFFTERPDFLISFLSPWIVPKSFLDNSGVSINFHSGSSDYPGAGCYNFALYEEAKEYGAVCHHMLPKVDTGAIIMERRFKILAEDDVQSLRYHALETMIDMFDEITTIIAKGRELPVSKENWTRRAFTSREIDELSKCYEGMPQEEIDRRVRATYYPGYPSPVLIFNNGQIKELKPR